jgi:GR25 family glycosyltransferase involved in LPS biosynthesis
MWEFIDKIVYINLDHRQDRRDVMAKFFEEGGMPSEKIIRFSAIKHTKGAIGCLASHTEVLRMAKKEGWKNVLILEDDLQWINLESAYQQLLELITKPKWDVILLCGWYKIYDFPRVYDSLNTGAYLVNGDYYDTLLANREWALRNIPKPRNIFSNIPSYAADFSWKYVMQKHMWYCLYPCICSQIDDYSDNSNAIIKASLAVGIFDRAVRNTIWK